MYRGGLIVVNHYGEYDYSIGKIEFGSITSSSSSSSSSSSLKKDKESRKSWKNLEEAFFHLHQQTNITSTKCSFLSPKIQIGGAGILLYVENELLDNDMNRKVLLKALTKELGNINGKTQIICLQGNLDHESFMYLYREQQRKNGERSAGQTRDGGENDDDNDSLCSDRDEKKSSDIQRKRADSISSILSAACIERDNLLIKCAAYSSFGSILTIMRAKGWSKPTCSMKIILYGITKLTCELYHLLNREKTTRIFLSDKNESKLSNPKYTTKCAIPPRALISWSKAQAKENGWDIIVYCTSADDCFPQLAFEDNTQQDLKQEEQTNRINPTIESLSCNPKALISLCDDFLPNDQEEKERILVHLKKEGIVEALDGLSDLGEIAKAYALFCCDNNTTRTTPTAQVKKGFITPTAATAFTFSDAFELGARVMRKKLHLHQVISVNESLETCQELEDLVYLVDEGGRSLNNPEEEEENSGLFGLFGVMHESSSQMTCWLWEQAKAICPAYRVLQQQKQQQQNQAAAAHYLDLGAGNGASARWICNQSKDIKVTCIDICPHQNAENRFLSDEEGFGSQIDIHLGSFESLNSDYSEWFDGCMSQHSLIVHAFDKLHAFQESFRVTRGGGFIVLSDMFLGKDISHTSSSTCSTEYREETEAFLREHNLMDPLATPTQCMDLAREAGYTQVEFTDLTHEIKKSLQNLVKKIKKMIDTADLSEQKIELLRFHRTRLIQRIGQADRKIFVFGIISARKPYTAVFLSRPPVQPRPSENIQYYIGEDNVSFGTDVLVVNIGEKLSRERIMALPSTTRLIVTLSAGLDHICVDAAKERGIHIRRAAREQIVKSVADYLVSNIIYGLRNGFQNIGVPFPSRGEWDLEWNADGVDLDCCKIGFIGMGAIAIETARRIRALSDNCEIVYHIPNKIRCSFQEGKFRIRHVGIADLLSTCDVVVPMCPLTEETTSLINYSSFSMMKKTAIFINMARGKVLETEGLTKALKEGLLRHAILDTTDPEPLPSSHDLWKLGNCTITPHFATNTTYVRRELVDDIPNQVEDTLEGRSILRLEEQRMRVELSEAYAITREFGMDELVWNHISCKLSDGTFLVTPGNRMFDDIGPQDLVKSSGNITADIIHEAIYSARDDVKAIVHLHTPATVAVACLEMGFVPLAQESAPFMCGRVSRLPWRGQSNDRDEQKDIGDAVLKDRNVNTLLMENHGFCTFGKTLGEAWVLAYYFDKACQTQLNCLQTGQKLKYPSQEVQEHAAKLAYIPDFIPGKCEWGALRKMLKRQTGRRHY